MSRPRTAFRLGIVCAIAVLCIGCLNAKKIQSFRYDADDDSFHSLTIYAHVHSARTKDHEWLAQLWKDRERLIFPGAWISIFDEPAYLKVSANEFQEINLGERHKKAPPVERTLPLGKITVLPGEFFLSPEKTLCYHHRVAVPGEVVDAILLDESRASAENAAEAVDNELERRKDGGKRKTWEEVRRQLVAEILQVDRAAGDKAKPEKRKTTEDVHPFMALDDTSLTLLGKMTSERTRITWREKATLYISLPLSAADCRELKATFDVAKAAVVELVKRELTGEAKQLEALRVAEKAVSVEVQETGGRSHVVLTADLPPLSRFDFLSATEDHKLEKPEASKAAEYQSTLDAIRKHGIPIREDVDIRRLLKEFTTAGKKSAE
jgi:hypothetical protein